MLKKQEQTKTQIIRWKGMIKIVTEFNKVQT
jgi:hypothetical protein